MSDDGGSDEGAVARAAEAGHADGHAGEHDPNDLLKDDTPEQKQAYEDSFAKGQEHEDAGISADDEN